MTAELCIVTLCSSLLKNDISDFNARLSRLEEQAARGEFAAAARPAQYADGYENEYRPETGSRAETDEDERETENDIRTDDGEPDEPDPEQFAEEQPEDAFTDRSPRAEPAAESPGIENAAAESPAQSGAQFWTSLSEAILLRLPADMRIYPRDGSKLRGELHGGVLELEAESGFVFNRFNRTEILQKFSQCASEIAGRAVNATVREMSGAGRETRSLDELKKFPETKIIG